MQKVFIITIAIAAVSTVGFLWFKIKKKSLDFELIIKECINKEKIFVEGVTAKLLIVCKENEKEVAIYTYQKYQNGKVIKKKITINFELSSCPLEVRNKLSESGQALVYSF